LRKVQNRDKVEAAKKVTDLSKIYDSELKQLDKLNKDNSGKIRDKIINNISKVSGMKFESQGYQELFQTQLDYQKAIARTAEGVQRKIEL